MAETRFEWTLDGESAGATPWEFDSINEAGSATIALDATNPNNGTNAYRYTSDGVGANTTGDYAWTNTDKAEYWVRFYLFVPTGTVLNQATFPLNLVQFFDGGTSLGHFGIRGNGGTTPNEWAALRPAGFVNYVSTNFSLNAWHRIEIRFVVDGSNGGIVVYVDGTAISTDIDQEYTYYVDTIKVGDTISSTILASSGTIDFDDIVGNITQPGVYSDDAGANAPTGALSGPLVGPLGGPING